MKSSKKASPLAVLITTVLCCILLGALGRANPSQPETQKDATFQKGTATAEDKQEPVYPTFTPAPAGIPDIMPADVTANMEERGFECTSVQEVRGTYIRDCTKDGMKVSLYGSRTFGVDFIEAIATDGNAGEFLGFVATIPFIDNPTAQDTARSWVRDNIVAAESQTVIEGIPFILNSNGTAASLQIGELK